MHTHYEKENTKLGSCCVLPIHTTTSPAPARRAIYGKVQSARGTGI